MASKLPVWGIDVGQCSLKAVKLHRVGDAVELLATDWVEHDNVLSQAEAEAPAMIRKAISTFISRNEIQGSQIVVAVPGQQTLTRFTKMPPVEAKKIPDMVRYEASQQIPFDMDEVVWDYQVFTGADSPDVEVGIFAIRKELIRNHLAHFTEQGLEPIIVQTSPMASYNAARYQWAPEDGKATILLDMGALATDLIIFEGNRIWCRPVPIGGNRFTEALVSAFKISFAKAEKLKRAAATSKYARQIFQAMRPVFADLASEVQRSIGFYTSTHRDTHITRVLGMGNAFKLPGIQKFLQQNLQLEVERAAGFTKIATAGNAAKPEFNENVMSFGVAMGLALQGLDLASVEGNLLPVEIRRMLLWRKKRSWFAASAASLLVGAGALWAGNLMASGQIAKDMGGRQESPGVIPVGGVDEAMQIIQSGSGAPYEWAGRVVGAAERLKQEYQRINAEPAGDTTILKQMAKLTEKNAMIPGIIRAVNRAVMETQPKEFRVCKSGAEYQRAAKSAERSERKELWLTSVKMIYSSGDPEKVFDPKANRPGISGWAIQIKGQTTLSQDKAPVFLEEFVAALDRVGKEPDRGFHFGKVMLDKIGPRSDRSRMGDGYEFGGDAPGGDYGRPPPRGYPGGRAPVGGRGGIGGRAPAGGMPPSTPPGGAGRSYGDEGVTSSVSQQLQQWAEKFRLSDPVTLEPVSGDQEFTINLIVYKGDAPKAEGGENKAGEPAAGRERPGETGSDYGPRSARPD